MAVRTGLLAWAPPAPRIRQGGGPWVGVPADPPGGGSLVTVGSVSIETNHQLQAGQIVGTGPAGVFFTAKAEGFVSSDPDWAAWKDLNYRWSFDDPGWYTRHDTDDLPWGRYYKVDDETVLVNDGRVPTGTSVQFLGNDKNIAFGPWVCHVFAPTRQDFDGQATKTFRVRCEVRAEPTEEPLLVVERDVIIHNPDSIFAGNKTALVCAAGDINDADDPLWEPAIYPGAVRCNTHLQALQGLGNGALQGNSIIAPVRILFRRGEAPVLAATSSQYWSPRSDKFQKLHIGSYGDPDDPPPTPIGDWDLRFGNNVPLADTEFAMYGIDHHGPYDPSDPMAVTRPGDGIRVEAGRSKTLWDMSIKGWNVCLNGAIADGRYGFGFTNFVFGNTFIGDWGGYGVFAAGDPKYHGQCGVWIKQNRGTVTGEGEHESGPPTFSDGAPLRCTRPGSPAAFCLVDLRSQNDWSGGKFQPCNRWGGTPDVGNSPGFEGALHYNWDRARGEGGNMIGQGASIQSNGIPIDQPALPVKGLYDKVYALAYVNVGRAGAISISGPVVRNSIIMYPDQPTMGNNLNEVFGGREQPGNPVPGENNAPPGSNNPIYYDASTLEHGVEVYSNTIVDQRSYSRSGAALIQPNLSDYWKYLVLSNNVEHAPDRPDLDLDADLDDTELWDAAYAGLRESPTTEHFYASQVTTNGALAPITVTDANRTVNWRLFWSSGGNADIVIEKRAGDSGDYTVVNTFSTGPAFGSIEDEGAGTWQYRARVANRTTGSVTIHLWAFPDPAFPVQTMYALPPGTAQRFAPLSTSPAYHGAEFGAGKKIAVDDFFGRIRTGTPSKGAVEPDPE